MILVQIIPLQVLVLVFGVELVLIVTKRALEQRLALVFGISVCVVVAGSMMRSSVMRRSVMRASVIRAMRRGTTVSIMTIPMPIMSIRKTPFVRRALNIIYHSSPAVGNFGDFLLLHYANTFVRKRLARR